MSLKGEFQITSWNEEDKKVFNNNTKLTIAEVTQQYSGDISGTSEITYQMYYDQEGNAAFTGFEVLVLSQECGGGMATLKHDGVFEKGIASSRFTVQESDNSLITLDMNGSFKSKEGGKANYFLFAGETV